MFEDLYDNRGLADLLFGLLILGLALIVIGIALIVWWFFLNGALLLPLHLCHYSLAGF